MECKFEYVIKTQKELDMKEKNTSVGLSQINCFQIIKGLF